jgi:hypothetical protein
VNLHTEVSHLLQELGVINYNTYTVSSSNTSTARARKGTEFAIILLSISVLCVRLIDIGALFAARAAQLVAPEVIAKKKQVDAKNCCSIVSFGDYEGEQWMAGLTFIYR